VKDKEKVIERDFTEPDDALRVLVRCYPPSPTIWVWLTFTGAGQPERLEFPSSKAVRAWVRAGCTGLRGVIGAGALQDFRADLVRVLNQIDGEFTEQSQ
jgi:hypothetical protein